MRTAGLELRRQPLISHKRAVVCVVGVLERGGIREASRRVSESRPCGLVPMNRVWATGLELRRPALDSIMNTYTREASVRG